MDDTSKYLIHAAITADGVVERSDVVGAVFGQTEGLLGDDLDLRDLQQSSKVGRIDVEIGSENGQSFGEITIASSLDKVETAILAAALETISRVGPCRARVEVTEVEDVRAAKRREVVDRAKELLGEAFDDSVMSSREILDEVRESVRVEDITEYAGYPAGPHVESSDAVIVVEGRADVLTLLRYGIKNAVAVEGTNVPDAVAALSEERNVTAFLDGDRGGKLILRELAQVGDVDYVAFAPEGRSVEDLARHEVMTALRGKVPYERYVADEGVEVESDEGTAAAATADTPPDPSTAVAATDGSATPAPEEPTDPRTESPETTDAPATPTPDSETETETDEPTGGGSAGDESTGDEPNGESTPEADESGDGDAETTAETEAGVDSASAAGNEPDDPDRPPTLAEHVEQVVDADSGLVRLLDADLGTVDEASVGDAFDAVRDADPVPHVVVVDGELTQRVLDVAAQRGVAHVVARSTGEFVKKPVSVRIRTADQLKVD
ncbi:DNA primase DnaG [Halobium salinum]|uniref:DNA primase DnaG n=1 Tax=Halobium salinum TaxID=1364940 RepID=A0ABD5P967_9EURY|nr:DNA primase DnaG [Halobium salinum]